MIDIMADRTLFSALFSVPVITEENTLFAPCPALCTEQMVELNELKWIGVQDIGGVASTLQISWPVGALPGQALHGAGDSGGLCQRHVLCSSVVRVC